MGVKIFGSSDDLCEIEGAAYPADEIGCYDKDCIVELSDETLLRVSYGKPNLGIWAIQILKNGSMPYDLAICEDENKTPYSDVFASQAEYKRHWVVNHGALPDGITVSEAEQEVFGRFELLEDETVLFRHELKNQNQNQDRKDMYTSYAVGLNSPWSGEDQTYRLKPIAAGWECVYSVIGYEAMEFSLYAKGSTPEEALSNCKKLFEEIQEKWNPDRDSI